MATLPITIKERKNCKKKECQCSVCKSCILIEETFNESIGSYLEFCIANNFNSSTRLTQYDLEQENSASYNDEPGELVDLTNTIDDEEIDTYFEKITLKKE